MYPAEITHAVVGEHTPPPMPAPEIVYPVGHVRPVIELSFALHTVPDDQIGTIISLAQARWRDEMRTQGVQVETPK